MDLLVALSKSPEPLSLKALADTLHLPRSTTLRLCTTLERHGFLSRDLATDQYALGPVLMQLGASASKQYPLHDIVRPHMVSLRNLSQETVNLYVPHDIYRVCVAQEESPQFIRQVIPLGRSLPIWVGASGLVLLAFMGEDQQRNIVERLTTMSTLTDYVAFTQILQTVKSQGWAVTHGQREPGASSLAAPIFSGDRITAALAISGPSHRFTDDRVQLFLPALLEKAKETSSTLVFTYTH